MRKLLHLALAMYTEVSFIRPTWSTIKDSICHQHRGILPQWRAEKLTWFIWKKRNTKAGVFVSSTNKCTRQWQVSNGMQSLHESPHEYLPACTGGLVQVSSLPRCIKDWQLLLRNLEKQVIVIHLSDEAMGNILQISYRKLGALQMKSWWVNKLQWKDSKKIQRKLKKLTINNNSCQEAFFLVGVSVMGLALLVSEAWHTFGAGQVLTHSVFHAGPTAVLPTWPRAIAQKKNQDQQE